MAAKGRHGARRLLVQALYQMQLAGHAPGELADQFETEPGYKSADAEYFGLLLKAITAAPNELDELITNFGDIPADIYEVVVDLPNFEKFSRLITLPPFTKIERNIWLTPRP